MKKKLEKLSRIDLLILVFMLLFLAVKGWRYLDPDFGWRLRTGKQIFQNGIPATDIYTYTMPSFPWVDHAWSQDVVIYLLHTHLGKFFLSLVWAVAALFALIIVSNIFTAFKLSKLSIFKYKNKGLILPSHFLTNIFLILGFLSISSYFGVRVQVVTWLMFAGIVKLLLKEGYWEKYRKFIPFYFLIWANLHGGFASGLAAVIIFLVFRTVRTRKLDNTDVLIFFSSVALTLVNPYGIELWREVWSSVSDGQLRWRIQEWNPFFINPSFPISFLMGLSSIILFIYRDKIKLEELMLYVFFFSQAMLSTRHVPLWVLIAVPLGIRSVNYLYEQSLTYKFGKQRFRLFYRLLWSIVILLFAGEMLYSGYLVARVDEGDFYPVKAVNYLKQNETEGRMFSDYGWGGYLIWKYPDKKVYIDGRMPSWRWNATIPGETNSAADDYFALYAGDADLEKELNKYDISVVLWPSEKEGSIWEFLSEKIISLFSREEDDSFSLDEEFEKIDWEKIYEDETAVIYINP